MVQVKSKIIYKQQITDKHFHLIIEGSELIKDSAPGKFIEIKIDNTSDPLLRRPIGIHRIQGKNLVILFEVVGKGTQILADKKTGEYLDVIGPLGRGFDFQSQVTGHRLQILVAGGMGVAPLVFLAERLREVKSQKSLPCRQAGKVKSLVLIGAKTKEYVLCENEFRALGCEVQIATDDGSKGFKGKVTDLLRNILLPTDYRLLPALYACGPKPMLREVSVISREHNIPAQLSLEAHMACGIGVCLGCVIKVKSQKTQATSGFEYKRVCKEGPVFFADEIVW